MTGSALSVAQNRSPWSIGGIGTIGGRAHAHLGAFRSVRIRWCRLLDSYEAFLATAAAHLIVRRAGL